VKPYEIFKKLQAQKSEKAVAKILSSISDEDEFWLCAHYALLPFSSWKVKLSFSNPTKYGAGVPDGIFTKIITGMENGLLSPTDTVYALSKFSQACSKDEWTKWYLPALERTLVLPFNAETFNKVCPKQFLVVREWEPVPARPIAATKQLPREFYIEPLLYEETTYWFCNSSSVRAFRSDGQEFLHTFSDDLKNVTTELNTGLVLVGYIDDGILVLTDVFPMDEVLHCDNNSLKYKVRREILENIVGKLQQGETNVDVIESYPVERNDMQAVMNETNLILQQGFNGVLFRDSNQGCGYPDILVHPTTKSVITCTGVDDKARFISGRGVLQKKKIQTNVLLGLTSVDKEQYLKNMDSLIGDRFEILSCGLRGT
jgi:predicted Rdx family selenoprotein